MKKFNEFEEFIAKIISGEFTKKTLDEAIAIGIKLGYNNARNIVLRAENLWMVEYSKMMSDNYVPMSKKELREKTLKVMLPFPEEEKVKIEYQSNDWFTEGTKLIRLGF